jgi:DNA polymerase/3'-5' exonuclease PolX
VSEEKCKYCGSAVPIRDFTALDSVINIISHEDSYRLTKFFILQDIDQAPKDLKKLYAELDDARDVISALKALSFTPVDLTKMPLDEARKIAEYYRDELAPYCERIEIAGSIRRNKPEVGDIEMVAIPKYKAISETNLFGESGKYNALETVIQEAYRNGMCLTKNGPRYKQIVVKRDINQEGYLVETIHIDLFIVLPPSQWGVQLLIRTGPAEFSKQAVTQRRIGGLLPSNCVVKDGQVLRNGELIPMSEEEDFLELLGMPGLKPEERR